VQSKHFTFYRCAQVEKILRKQFAEADVRGLCLSRDNQAELRTRMGTAELPQVFLNEKRVSLQPSVPHFIQSNDDACL
jgi:hypothetical protein